MSAPFATLADYELRYGAVADGDGDRVSALLADASDALLAAYESAWGGYKAGDHPAFDRAACSVACSVVSRAVNVRSAWPARASSARQPAATTLS